MGIGKNFKFTTLVVGILLLLLVVVLFVIFHPRIIERLPGQHNSEIPNDIIYRQPEQGFNRDLRPELDIEDINFSEEYLDGPDTNELSITIRNKGPGDARNLTIQIRLSTNPDHLEKEVSYPKITEVATIPEGEKKTVDIDITGSMKLSKGKAKIKSYLIDSNFGRPYSIEVVSFKTRKFATPKLELEKWEVNGVATGKSEIRLYENIKLEFHVHNNSRVKAEDVKVQVKNKQKGVISSEAENMDNNTILTTSAFKIINEDDRKSISHTYSTNKDFEDSELEFTISATVKNNADYGFDEIITKRISRKTKPLGKVTIGKNDDESPLQEPLKSFGNNLWIIPGIILLVLCCGAFIIWRKRRRRDKQTKSGSTTSQSKPNDSKSREAAAYREAAGRKERFK